jgi:hypothetical protein
MKILTLLQDYANSSDNLWLAKQLEILTEQISTTKYVEIKDKDISTIEALHDTLLDKKVLGLNARCMKESRELTARMYKAINNES